MAGDDQLEDWDEEWDFSVPPPPPPPSLGAAVCSASEFYCQVEGGPMGAHFNRATSHSLPIIAVCSSVVFVAVLVASFLLWRHKSKVQNLLPCKNEQQGHIGDMGAANGVNYEDILGNHHHHLPTRIPQGHLTSSQTLMPLEILDVKLGDIGSSQLPPLHHIPCYPTRDIDHVISGKPFNPVYEEVSQTGVDRSTPKNYGTTFTGKRNVRSLTSDDDFQEEEFGGSGQCSATSSVRGSTGGDLCKDPVSSDEGTGEDCDYTINNLPSDNCFNYPRQPVHPSGLPSRPEKLRQHNHLHTRLQHTNQLPERTAKVVPLTQSAMESVNLHSKPLHMSPTRMPPAYAPRNGQWQNKMNFPASASQENIYSTIDEDDDYPPRPPVTSLAHSQRGSPPDKTHATKSAAVRGNRQIPLLSQRNNSREENGSSYGDMMPAFHSATFM